MTFIRNWQLSAILAQKSLETTSWPEWTVHIHIKITCRCISPRFSTTFVLVNLIFFEYLLAFLKKTSWFVKNLKENVELTKIQNSMKCSIFRTHGKSENWICIFIWLKSLETKTWKCEFLTFYKLTEWNGNEPNTFFTSNRKTTENNFVFSIFEKIEKFRLKIIWIKFNVGKTRIF